MVTSQANGTGSPRAMTTSPIWLRTKPLPLRLPLGCRARRARDGLVARRLINSAVAAALIRVKIAFRQFNRNSEDHQHGENHGEDQNRNDINSDDKIRRRLL